MFWTTGESFMFHVSEQFSSDSFGYCVSEVGLGLLFMPAQYPRNLLSYWPYNTFF